MIEISIKCQPIPKGRPRLGRGYTYTPPRTVAYEEEVALAAKLAMRGRAPLEGPLTAYLFFWMPLPKKRKNAEPITGADLDNLIKGVWDAMNKIVFMDDSQIVSLRASKGYSAVPGALVLVKPYIAPVAA